MQVPFFVAKCADIGAFMAHGAQLGENAHHLCARATKTLASFTTLQDTPGADLRADIGDIVAHVQAQNAAYLALEFDPGRTEPMSALPVWVLFVKRVDSGHEELRGTFIPVHKNGASACSDRIQEMACLCESLSEACRLQIDCKGFAPQSTGPAL